LSEPDGKAMADGEVTEAIERCRLTFREAMDDDFNTPMAIAAFQKLRNDMNKLLTQGISFEARMKAKGEFHSLGSVLGLFNLDKWHYVLQPQSGSYHISGQEVEVKIVERNEARRKKDFKRADEIRQFLASHGIIIEDKPDGTSRWKR